MVCVDSVFPVEFVWVGMVPWWCHTFSGFSGGLGRLLEAVAEAVELGLGAAHFVSLNAAQ